MEQELWKEVILTQGDQVPVVLHHHIHVQFLLSWVQAFPLLLREIYSHIPEGQWSLKKKDIYQGATNRIHNVTQLENSVRRSGFDLGEYPESSSKITVTQ